MKIICLVVACLIPSIRSAHANYVGTGIKYSGTNLAKTRYGDGISINTNINVHTKQKNIFHLDLYLNYDYRHTELINYKAYELNHTLNSFVNVYLKYNNHFLILGASSVFDYEYIKYNHLSNYKILGLAGPNIGYGFKSSIFDFDVCLSVLAGSNITSFIVGVKPYVQLVYINSIIKLFFRVSFIYWAEEGVPNVAIKLISRPEVRLTPILSIYMETGYKFKYGYDKINLYEIGAGIKTIW